MFEIKKNLSINNTMKIRLISENLKDKKSDIVNLKVFLSLSYHLESFEFTLPASTRKNIETGNIEFNMGDILETIFQNLVQDFLNNYFLSYYMKGVEDRENDLNTAKVYKYLGEINLEKIKKKENLFFEIPEDKVIYLKLWQKIKKENLLNPSFFDENEEEYSNQIFQDINLDEDEEEEKKGSGRVREKTIGFAIIKVCKWEKIREKSKNKITLDDAAKSIGMAKKTLDDYKNQIKEGKKNNFNFNKYYKCKMNVLKDYNKGKLKLD